jgi:hypothetical protein
VEVTLRGCALFFLPVPAMAFTCLYLAFGGPVWVTAAGLWFLWAYAAWGSWRDWRRALEADRARLVLNPAPEPVPLPQRLLPGPAELAALDGEADLHKAVWATMAPEDSPSPPWTGRRTRLYGRHLD